MEEIKQQIVVSIQNSSDLHKLNISETMARIIANEILKDFKNITVGKMMKALTDLTQH